MRAIKYTVTSAELNALATGDEITIDLKIEPDQQNNDIYPRYVRIDNESAGKIGYILINSGDEKERLIEPTWYAPIPLLASVSDLSLGIKTTKFILQQLDDGTACTGDIDLYFTNYFDY